MSTNRYGKDGEDKIGKWSEEKIELLAKYISAYSKIMNKQQEEWLKYYYYIDAFAGSVEPVSKEEERYIQGSPLRALNTEPRFNGYWFIDINPQRIERLKKLQADFPNHNIILKQDNCNNFLSHEIINIITWESKQRAIIFLDPYGLQVNWTTIVKLAQAKTFDLFINFPLMGITRLLKRDHSPDQNAREKINTVMGNTDWIDKIYQPPSAIQMNLFENEESNLVRDLLPAEWLASLYAEQLNQLFKYVSQPVIMKNSTNSPIYALLVASHKETAKKISNDIFNRYEKLKKLG